MSKMLIGLVRLSLPAALASALCVQPAQADIYTWVDASGTINVSNLAPPDGVSVTRVVHAAPPVDPAAHDAQVQALMQRVGELENAVESAQRQVAPPMPYPIIPQAPLVEYVVNVAPPVSYDVGAAAPSPTAGCDPSWMDCGQGGVPAFYPIFYPIFYPTSLVVPHPPYFSRPRPIRDHRVAAPQPMHAIYGGNRRG
jgi:hypothetical protein